jgi:hypothetical protein
MRSTLSSQVQVIAWTIILIAVVLGAIGMWYSLGAPEAKADLAWKLRGYSLACWAFAAAVYVGYRALDYMGG